MDGQERKATPATTSHRHPIRPLCRPLHPLRPQQPNPHDFRFFETATMPARLWMPLDLDLDLPKRWQRELEMGYVDFQ